MSRRLTWRKVIEDCRNIHDDFYWYDESEQEEYISVKTHMVVHCPEHGVFYPTVANHKGNESGCPECGKIRKNDKNRLDWETVIGICEIKHDNYYSYYLDEQIEYVDTLNTLITLHCPEHGRFEMSVSSHMYQGSGCNQCGIERTTEKKRLNWDDILRDCIEVHDGYYKYVKEEQPEYTGNKTCMMVIHCPKHGRFEMIVNSHKDDAQGCRECGIERSANKRRSNWDDVITQCEAVYGEEYSYDIYKQSEYINSHDTRIIVTCELHGDFEVQVYRHKNNGSGCPKCKSSHGERTISNYLDDQDICYGVQHKYPDCCGDSRSLPFDFYLPDHNILIEYDGKQHYEYLPEFFHKKGYWQFEKQQEYDEIKNNYCRDNDINLIRIRYDVEDIVLVLNELLL